jgi:hypothetical protein
VEDSCELILIPFISGSGDHKVICGHCQSPQPIGAISNGNFHYRRKGWGEFWINETGFRAICSNCGLPGHISWETVKNST